MADRDSIFDNLPSPRKRILGYDDDTRGMDFREMFTLQREGPLRPRPSGKGGPSIGQGAVVVTGSVWSASDAAANGMTLSNGGLTVTQANTAWATMRNTISKTSGKVYVEFLAASVGATDNQFWGLANSGINVNNYLGQSTFSGAITTASFSMSTGFSVHFGIPNVFPVANDVYAFAVDFATGNVWMSKNNVWFFSSTSGDSNPVTGTLPIFSFVPATVGPLFAAISLHGPADGVWTLQATAASQKYAPPSGFSAWDGGAAPPPTSVWSASDAATGSMTLSNGGLTATASIANWNAIRGTISKTTGKFYYEVKTSVTATSQFAGVGFSDASFVPSNGTYLGATGASGGAYLFGSQFNSVGVFYYGFPATTANSGDVLSVAIDLDARIGWIAYNNVWQGSGNPTTGANPAFQVLALGKTGVGIFPAMAFYNTGGVWTLQATAASQTYAPPAGFTPWG